MLGKLLAKKSALGGINFNQKVFRIPIILGAQTHTKKHTNRASACWIEWINGPALSFIHVILPRSFFFFAVCSMTWNSFNDETDINTYINDDNNIETHSASNREINRFHFNQFDSIRFDKKD